MILSIHHTLHLFLLLPPIPTFPPSVGTFRFRNIQRVKSAATLLISMGKVIPVSVAIAYIVYLRVREFLAT